MGAPVTDADWLYGCAVLFVPVEDVRIGNIKSAVGRGQSTDADPGTDVEDELPTPASSPVQCTTPAVMTGESARQTADLSTSQSYLGLHRERTYKQY